MSMGVRLGVLVCAVLLVIAAPAWAHTGLSSSTPADGASVDGPLDELTLTFSRPIKLAGAGVEVLDAAGDPVTGVAIVDDEVVTVVMEQPLRDGPFGVRWAVRSGDAHPVRGTFTFAVTPVARARSAGVVSNAIPIGSADGLARALMPASAHGAMAAAPAAAPAPAPEQATDVAAGTGALAAALAEDPAQYIIWVDQALRAVFWAAALGAVGVLVFVIGVWDGPRREVRRLTRLCARLAAVAALVVIAQPVVRSARTAGTWSDALAGVPAVLTDAYATGTVLRGAGAVLLAAGLGRLRRSLSGAVTPIAGGAVDVHPAPAPVVTPTPSTARRLRSAAVPVLGALLLIASFAFVGHAASAEPRHIAVAAVVAHSTAAAIWGGGLLALVATLSARRGAGVPLRAGLIAVRFSVAATVGVILAGAAGGVLAAVRLEDVAELWTTLYGQLLVAKIAVVGVIGTFGWYNHFVLVPRLRRDPNDLAGRHLHRLGVIEISLFVVVIGLTSALIGAAG